MIKEFLGDARSSLITRKGRGVEFTEAFAQLAAGVVVATVRDDRDDLGTTVTAFTALSVDPPLAMVSLAIESYLREVLERRPLWAATMLSAGQTAIASRFATPGRPSARLLLAGVRHHRGDHTEALIIEGGTAALECETVQRMPTGDHMLFVARVIDVDYVDARRDPLVRLRSRYRPMRSPGNA